MANVSSIIEQLKKERDRVERQLSGLNAALTAFAGVYGGTVKPMRKRHKMSAKSRAQIAAAQRRRSRPSSGSRPRSKSLRHTEAAP
jgi:hypothetical protein